MSVENTNLNNVLPFRMADTDVARRAVEAARTTLHPGWHDYIANASDFLVEVLPGGRTGFGYANDIVRVTHKPTGISRQCSTSRSQHANKNSAFDLVLEELKKPQKEVTPAIPKKEEITKVMAEVAKRPTKWLDTAIKAITDHFSNVEIYGKTVQNNSWTIIVKGDPSEYDIIKLKEMLVAAGWDDHRVTPPDYDNNATYITLEL